MCTVSFLTSTLIKNSVSRNSLSGFRPLEQITDNT